uniref:ATP synthase CF1 delta subunit n=1 Tax=Compsopogon caeruleus TaxID=31354 RepID=A0A1Z1XB76_9RHOD|nr:ATP synthase CF1 delta subunit [Compsopogon caeruleus]ARX96110.1 ATP synthase CF1 delta subunit [Compsopogon caeruleus]
MEVYEKEASLILDILNNSNDLELLISNPLISATIKKNTLSKVFSNDLSSLFLNFLMVLVDRGRINILRVILEKFLELGLYLDRYDLLIHYKFKIY